MKLRYLVIQLTNAFPNLVTRILLSLANPLFKIYLDHNTSAWWLICAFNVLFWIWNYTHVVIVYFFKISKITQDHHTLAFVLAFSAFVRSLSLRSWAFSSLHFALILLVFSSYWFIIYKDLFYIYIVLKYNSLWIVLYYDLLPLKLYFYSQRLYIFVQFLHVFPSKCYWL